MLAAISDVGEKLKEKPGEWVRELKEKEGRANSTGSTGEESGAAAAARGDSSPLLARKGDEEARHKKKDVFRALRHKKHSASPLCRPIQIPIVSAWSP